MSIMQPKAVTDETKFGNQIMNGQQYTTGQTMQDKTVLERQLPPFNSLNVGQHHFDIHQQLVKNGNHVPMPANTTTNNAPMANQATENGNSGAPNANNAQVNLGEQDQYSLLQLLLPLDRPSHNM